MQVTHAECFSKGHIKSLKKYFEIYVTPYFNGPPAEYIARMQSLPEVQKVICPLKTLAAFFTTRNFDEGL